MVDSLLGTPPNVRPHEPSGTMATQAAARVLGVLDVLWRNYAHGWTPGEIVRATGLSGPAITRALTTLEASGYAERLPDGTRWRVSTTVARRALQILQSIDAAERQLAEARARLMTPQ